MFNDSKYRRNKKRHPKSRILSSADKKTAIIIIIILVLALLVLSFLTRISLKAF